MSVDPATFLKLTDEQIKMKYQLEIDLISARDQFKHYAQAKLSNVVTRDKYDSAVKAIKENDKNVYQTIGKAYILRPRDELLGDYESLIDENNKEKAEIEVRESYFLFSLCLDS